MCIAGIVHREPTRPPQTPIESFTIPSHFQLGRAMRYPPHILDEIRARLSVSDVVARKVALKKKGREFSGLSPFKSEKTPSFFVNDQKGFYHCFASGEHGDIFTFLMKTEGLSFPEAVEKLASESGVDLPKSRPERPEVRDERERLYALMEAATRFYELQLKQSHARDARQYLTQRGLSQATIANFRIGYAPNNRNATGEHLKSQGFTVPEIVKAGMYIAGTDIPAPYDRFRNRITFPICDARGHVIAFGGRALDPKQPAKYLNSPETALFHKGRLLFNAHRARTPAHQANELVVAEGYMDVIALAQAGFEHAVAPLGTALTADQMQLLWRMCPEPTLCFDGDSAGQRAAHRAIDTVLPLLKPGHSMNFAFLPKGMDPDDLVREQGPGAMRRTLAACQSLADVLWQREWQAGDWSTPERRAMLEKRLKTLIAQIADSDVQNHYQRIIGDRLREAWRPQYRRASTDRGRRSRDAMQPWRHGQLRHNSNNRKPGFDGASALHSESLRHSRLVNADTATPAYRETLLIRTVINHPWLLEDAAEDLAQLNFTTPALQQLAHALLEAVADDIALDRAALRTHLNGLGLDVSIEKLERGASHKCDGFAEPDAERITVEDGWHHTLALHKQYLLREQLAEAEREYSASLDEHAMARILELQRLIAHSSQQHFRSPE